MKEQKRVIWIAWEKHRRTNELVKALSNIKLYQLVYEGNRIVKYFVLCIRTIKVIARESPEIIFVQNPSIVLTTLVLLLKKLLTYHVVVDLHTRPPIFNNFLEDIVDCFERFALRNADLTIVTNNGYLKITEKRGARGFILPDKVPEFNNVEMDNLNGKDNLVFICTFARDEPVDEVIKAAEYLDSKTVIYITGNLKNANKLLIKNPPPNIIFTDFLPENEFIQLLSSSDAIIVLTTQEHCLVCGAYESMSLCKPLITSDTYALRWYFNKGTVYTDNQAFDISKKIREVLKNKEQLSLEMKVDKEMKNKQWETRKVSLLSIINSMARTLGETKEI